MLEEHEATLLAKFTNPYKDDVSNKLCKEDLEAQLETDSVYTAL